MGYPKWAYVGLIIWWFAIINYQGGVEYMGTFMNRRDCITVHDLYEKLNLNKYKITKCTEGYVS